MHWLQTSPSRLAAAISPSPESRSSCSWPCGPGYRHWTTPLYRMEHSWVAGYSFRRRECRPSWTCGPGIYAAATSFAAEASSNVPGANHYLHSHSAISAAQGFVRVRRTRDFHLTSLSITAQVAWLEQAEAPIVLKIRPRSLLVEKMAVVSFSNPVRATSRLRRNKKSSCASGEL